MPPPPPPPGIMKEQGSRSCQNSETFIVRALWDKRTKSIPALFLAPPRSEFLVPVDPLWTKLSSKVRTTPSSLGCSLADPAPPLEKTAPEPSKPKTEGSHRGEMVKAGVCVWEKKEREEE